MKKQNTTDFWPTIICLLFFLTLPFVLGILSCVFFGLH